MNVNDKFFWDEVMNGINEKFTDEAAELMSRKSCRSRNKGENEKADDEYPEDLGPTMKIKLTPEEQHPKRRVMGGIFAVIAAAAAIALAVGISVIGKNGDLTSDNSSNSSHTQSGVNLKPYETSETTDTPDIQFNAKIDTDINSYTLDFALYEKYFHGIWGDDIYIGYTYAGIPGGMDMLYSNVTHIGFRQADGGCYMGIFSGTYEQFIYISDSNPDIMRSGGFERNSGEHYIADLDSTLSKKGDFEEKGRALNCMGMLKLCESYGVDPGVITECAVTGADGKEYRLYDKGSLYSKLDSIRFNGERVNESGQRQLCFSAKWREIFADVNFNDDPVFMAFCITETEDGWSAPEFCAGYDPESDDTPVYPEGLESADGVDFGMVEDVLLGVWHYEKSMGSAEISYNDPSSYSGLDPFWKASFEDENGWYFLIGDGSDIVYFIPKTDPDTLYVYLDKNDAKNHYFQLMYRRENPGARDLELTGELTYTGEQHLFDMYGDDFRDTLLASSFPYRREGRSPQNQYINGLHYICENEGVYVVSLSEDEVELSTVFVRDKSTEESSDPPATIYDGEQMLMWKYFRKNGKWDYYQPQCYIDGDHTGVYGMYDTSGAPDCTIYELEFFGDWISDTDGSVLTINYSENMFGETDHIKNVCKGKDGYYLVGTRTSPAVTYYIPFYDENSMYMYKHMEGERRSLTKNYYDEAFRRDTSSDYSTELEPGMLLCDMGIEKICRECVGGNLREICRKTFNLGFIDDEGVAWRTSDPYYGDGKPLLERIDDYSGVVMSTDFYGSNIGGESAGTARYRIVLECIDKESPHDDWVCFILDENGRQYVLYDPYEDDEFARIVKAYVSAYPEKSEAIYFTAENLSMTSDYRSLLKFDRSEAYEVLYGNLDYLMRAEYSKIVKGEQSELHQPSEKEELLPERGKISPYELARLEENIPEDMSGTIERWVSGWEMTDDYGNKWISDGLAGKDIYLTSIYDTTLEKPSLALLIPFVNETMGERYFEVTFGWDYNQCHALMYPSPNNFDFTFTGDKITVEGGYYFMVDQNSLEHEGNSLTLGNPDKDAETAIYFYDESDGIYYPVYKGIYHPRRVTDGKNLFVIAENHYMTGETSEIITVTSYGGNPGQYGQILENPRRIYNSSKELGDTRYDLTVNDIYFLGEYLVGEYNANGERKYCLFSAYEPRGAALLQLENGDIIRGTELKTDETGFTLNVSGEELRFDTTGDDLEGMYPLLKTKYAWLRTALELHSNVFGSRSVYSNWGGRVCAGVPLCEDYKSFIEWAERTIGEEYIGSVLASCNAKPGESNGLMYYNEVINYGSLEYSKAVLSKIDYTDETRAVLNFDLYGFIRVWDYEGPTDEPVDSCTLIAVKTKDGWRFTDISAPIE